MMNEADRQAFDAQFSEKLGGHARDWAAQGWQAHAEYLSGQPNHFRGVTKMVVYDEAVRGLADELEAAIRVIEATIVCSGPIVRSMKDALKACKEAKNAS